MSCVLLIITVVGKALKLAAALVLFQTLDDAAHVGTDFLRCHRLADGRESKGLVKRRTLGKDALLALLLQSLFAFLAALRYFSCGLLGWLWLSFICISSFTAIVDSAIFLNAISSGVGFCCFDSSLVGLCKGSLSFKFCSIL